MSGNSFGSQLKLTTFGESHGVAIGGILEGFPAGISIDFEAVQKALDRRKPGQSELTTDRKESDTVQFLSGIFEGKSLGTPIGFIIPNTNQKSKDYDALKDVYRPSHADYSWDAKYGSRDHRGGGRSSARETACRVVGGALAAQLMAEVKVSAFVQAVGPISISVPYTELDLSKVDASRIRCPHPETASSMEDYILKLKEEGDSAGGVIQCVITGVPAGWGEPVFDKLHAELGKAMLSINAVKGFEYGSGFAGTELKGSELNDSIESVGVNRTNHSGGIQGGISNGEDIYFRVAFKPIASIKKKQSTVNKSGEQVDLEIQGRHDPTVLPRAVPIVEAMAQLTLADFMLRAKTNRI
ncbi:chorismate synthase [Phaeocystidibacter luteus]|uniref:Chorismate synthase n=1 Tax=Phaeocystidibacter luteus TaxID=911197 RepID=A0A6N6RFI1_9FLAO|nr:chorismate synthase [Phaeocystidibacter luteus]KAB2809902.1 chorismate synthase [Phaeocystidibacter luteus]